MALRLLAPPATLVGASIAYYYHHMAHKNPILLQTYHCDPPSFGGFRIPWLYRKPPPRRNYLGFTPTTYGQISTGSLVGMAVGLCVARLGRTLCLIVGALMAVEELAKRGIKLIPPGRIRGWAEGADLGGLVMKHTAFKVSFGAAFIVASIMYG